MQPFVLADKYLDILWLPNMVVFNQYSASKLLGLMENQRSLYWLVKRQVIELHFDFQVEIQCRNMNFDLFPMDTQICYLVLTESKYLNSKDIFFDLAKFSFEPSTHENTLDYIPNITKSDVQSLVILEDWENFKSCLSIASLTIRLERKSWHYLMNHYMTSGLLAIVSWVHC